MMGLSKIKSKKVRKSIAMSVLAFSISFSSMPISAFADIASNPVSVHGVMTHPTKAGDIKMSKQYIKEGDDEYTVKVRVEAKDALRIVEGGVNTVIERLDPNVIHATVLSIDTSGSFSGVSSDAKSAIRGFVDRLFAMGDNMEFALLGTNGEDFTGRFLGSDKKYLLYSAITEPKADGGHGIADYDKAFKMIKELKERYPDKKVKGRIISLFDGDEYSKWDDVKKEASENDIDLYAIAFGDNNKDNVKLGASKPSFYVDSTLDGVEKAYETVVEEIKKTSEKLPPQPVSVSMENPVANVALDYGFSLEKGSIKCVDGSAEVSNDLGGNFGNIVWNIGSLNRSLPGDNSVKIAEMEYKVKLNRDLAHKNPVTAVHPSMALSFDLNGERQTVQYNDNSVNLLNAVVDLEKLVEEKNKTIADLNKKIDDLVSENHRLSEKVQELTDLLAKEREKTSALTQHIADLNHDIDLLNKQIDENKASIKELTERIIDLNGKYEAYKAKYEEEIKHNEALMAEISKKDGIIKDLQGHIGKLTDENVLLLSKISDLEKVNKELLKDNTIKTETIKHLREKIDELTKKNEELLSENETLKAEIDKLKELISSLEKENITLKHTIEEKEAKIKSLFDIIQEKIKKIIELSPIRDVNRYEGKNRTYTSLSVSKTMKESKNAILVKNEADALTASMLARSIHAPIINMSNDESYSDVEAELNRLGVKKIYLIGGESTLPKSLEDKLASNYAVERISGKDRVDTSLAIANKLKVDKEDDAILANGWATDSLIATGYNKISPIILSHEKSLGEDALKYLKSKSSILVVGGEKSINNDIINKLPRHIRVSGHDRYETAINFAKAYHKAPRELILVDGNKMADAISSTGLMKENAMPVLLSKDSKLDSNAKEYINEVNPKTINIVGGDHSVSHLIDKTLSYKLK